MRCLSASFIVLCACSAMFGQPATAPESSSLARDVAKAFAVYDNSVRTLEWTQQNLLRVGTPDETVMTSAQGFDPSGQWYRSQDEVVRRPGKPEYALRGHCAWNGFTLAGTDELSKTGTIQEYTGWRMSEMGPDCWFGRQFDVSSGKRLSESLVAAPDLRLGDVSIHGLPVLVATVANIQFTAMVELEIDPVHGFAPRSITFRDAAIRLPYYRYETIEYESHGDLWLPKKGRLETRNPKMTAEQSRAFSAALERHHLARTANASDPAVQAAYMVVLREAFGADEAPSVAMVPPIEVIWNYTNVNGPVPEEQFRVPLPDDYNILNCYTNQVRKPGETAWVDND